MNLRRDIGWIVVGAWLLVAPLSASAQSQAATAARTPDARDSQSEAGFEDIWLSHLEQQRDRRGAFGAYLSAPLSIARGLMSSAIGLAAPGIDDSGRIALAASGSLWLTGGFTYYALPDPEHAARVHTVLVNVGALALHTSTLGLGMGCYGQANAACTGVMSRDDGRALVQINAVSGIASALLAISFAALWPMPTVSDLRRGWDTLTPVERRARLRDHLQARARVQSAQAASSMLIMGATAGAFALAATQADNDAGQLWLGAAAGVTTSMLLLHVVWQALRPDEAAQLAAGTLPQ